MIKLKTNLKRIKSIICRPTVCITGLIMLGYAVVMQDAYIFRNVTCLLLCLGVAIMFAFKEDTRYKDALSTRIDAIMLIFVAYLLIVKAYLVTSNVGITFLISGFVFLIPSLIVDHYLKELPDSLSASFAICCLIGTVLVWGFNPMACVYVLVTFSLAAIVSLRGLGLGFGDVKLLIPISYLIPNIYQTMLFWVGAISIMLPYLIFTAWQDKVNFKEQKLKFEAPFGPSLILSIVLVFFLIP